MNKNEEIKIYNGGLSVDDRGVVSFVNEFDFKNVKRSYMVENHRKGFIRAWHYHDFEAKYVYVVSGSILLGAVKVNKDDLKSSEIKKYILSSKQPKVIYIPSGHANGFKTLEDDTKIIFYSTSTLEESLKDDVRYPFDQWDIWKEEFR